MSINGIGRPRSNLDGSTFCRLTVEHWDESVHKWSCRCSCGRVVLVNTGELTRGKTKSCGCYRRELRVVSNITHLKSKSSEYRIWESMKRRCHDKSCSHYQNYGGRGISVCERWRESFIAFYNDVGPRPSKIHSIERNDNDGDYCPENCRWATRAEQSRNTRRTVFLELNGKRQCIADWSIETGLDYETIRARLRKGWPIDRVLGEHPNSKWIIGLRSTRNRRSVLIEFDGKIHTLKEWSRIVGVNFSTLRSRIESGWSLADALKK